MNLSSTVNRRLLTGLLLAVILLFVTFVSPFSLSAPAIGEGTEPIATVTPVVTAGASPVPGPASPSEASGEDDAQAKSGGLFSEVDGDPPPSIGVDILASRLVGIEFGQLDEVTKPPVDPKDPATEKPSTPQTLVLNLFDDVVFTGIIEHVEPTASGHALWGRLEGVELGTVTLVVNGKIVVGTVRTFDAVYSIRTAGGGMYVIRQVDGSSLPPLGEPLEGQISTRDATGQADHVPLDDGSEIDLMVVYTPSAKRYEVGRARIEALIDLFVAETNQANENSGVIHRIRLVHREEVDYTEDSSGSYTDIDRLRDDSDGYMDHVHDLRDLYSADLVHLVVGVSNVGGLAYVADDESAAFGLTASYRKDLAFPHEIGHNMGLHHDRYEVGVPRRGSNYGYVNQRAFEPNAPESARWRTIMAYPDQCQDVLGYWCTWLPYFSNPDKSYKGDPLGVPADYPSTGVDGPADAVGILNDRRETIANYRPSSTSPTPRMGLALSQYWLPERGGVSTVTATLHRTSSEDTVLTISASPASAVNLSGNGTLTIPAGERVSDGAVTITTVDNDGQTGDVIVEISATATNTSDLGVVAPAPVELAIADDETTPVLSISLSSTEIMEGAEWPENRTVVTATLDNRSSAETTVTISASPAEAVEEIFGNPRTIPPGQTVTRAQAIFAADDTEFVEAKKIVTVSGTATNPQGVTSPESVTLTIIDDDAPIFADDSISLIFTAGVPASRVLPEAEYGNEPLTYSLSPAPSNDVTFAPGPPARIGVSTTSVAADEKSYTLTATDAQGDTDTMTVSIKVLSAVCPNSAAVSGHGDPGIVADCEALLASKDTLRGEQLLNWGEDLSMGEWQGVSIVDNRVTELHMSELGLSGTIPSELGSIAELQVLDFSYNKLTGEIPPDLVGLVKLQSLDVRSNQLVGTIPPALGDLTELQLLGLGWNELTGQIPAELGNLAKLQSLHLSGNELTGQIPAELSELVNLQALDLRNNNLTGEILAELGGLTNLHTLGLGGNELTGEIPAELGGLTNLHRLWLGFNQLTGKIPTELGDLNNLRDLSLVGNQLTGGIPAELGGLSNLEELALNQNEFTGPIPAQLGSLSKLRYLRLSWNQLTGPIPAQLGGLINLRELVLGENQLTGEIPSELGALSNLLELRLGRNELTGPIPTELGNLGNLRWLSLSQNRLTGKIPSELGDLSNLQGLYLSHNRLTGEIPSELGDLFNLQGLYLSGNQLTGCVPDELRDVPDNDFAELGLPFCSDFACVSGGAVPDATNTGLVSDCAVLLRARDVLAGTAKLNWSAETPIADWSGIVVDGTPGRVTELQLGGLGLDGEIPTELGSLVNLRSLDLSDNQLTGIIPTELGNLVNLQELYLGGNRLTGCVPDGLRDVPNNDIGGLGLSFCSEHPCVSGGAVPDATNTGLVSDCETLLTMRDTLAGTATLDWAANTPVADWSGVRVDGFPERAFAINLSGRGLTGKIPTELGSLANLTRLVLHTNELTGEIPREIGGLSNLRLLRLDENMLTGAIPMELGNLSHLTDMELWQNRLSGEIPTELGNLFSLVVLTLWGNQLTGEIPTELGNLKKLEILRLRGNQLTGCIPARLRVVPANDFDRLVLPFCPLSPPEAPTIGSVTTEIDSLAVSWSPPSSDGGSDITAYDLRYIETDGDETVDSNWTLAEDVWITGSGPLDYTLTGLTPAIEYDIQVRAVNEAGDGPWSETVTGTPTSSVCVTGGAVMDADNTGLISDCEVLLEARDTLAGTGTLNWAGDTPIADWDGVGLGGTPRRVTRLSLAGKGLIGTIPPVLGRLSMLTHLNLRSNPGLSGEIPAELGYLSNLRVLNLHSNSHSGPIPDLSGASSLEELYLPNNADDDDGNKIPGTGLTGEIPTWLNGMTKLRELWLWGNSLSGSVPDLSGMTSLDKLKLANNDLMGGVPAVSKLPPNMTWLIIDRNPFGGTIPDMSSLSRLRLLWLHSSELTGSIPAGNNFPASLDDLNLRDNMLMGGIPDLSNLDNLSRLRLHNNSLSGEVPATLGGLDSLQRLWLHNEDATKTSNGNNAFTSIAAGVGDLADTLIVIALSGNPWADDACVPAELANVARNDYAAAGLEVCSATDGS